MSATCSTIRCWIVLRLTAVGIASTQLAARFSELCWSFPSPVVIACRLSFQRLFSGFAPVECCEQLERSASTYDSTRAPEARSCGITLTHTWRPLLCVVNVGLLDHFIRIFIRGLLTHIFHHVTLILCKDWCSLAISTARLLSVGHRLHIATVVQLCEVVHHGGQFGVHFRVS